jgi:hypothetical protein
MSVIDQVMNYFKALVGFTNKVVPQMTKKGKRIQFIAKQDFYSPEMRSAYCAGLRYSLYDENTKLQKQFKEWHKDGLVEPCNDTQGGIRGRG